MTISIIVAISNNNVIGKNNELLWHLPLDFKHFKEITSGHPIIMGRKTFESIGRPLPHRRNIVITRDTNYKKEGIEVMHSLKDALKLFLETDEEVFVIGGGEIYQQAFPIADKLYVTEVHTEVDGDTVFPKINPAEWEEISIEDHDMDDEHMFTFSFVEYKKIR